MVKPEYPKRADLSQLARSIVELATGGPLVPSKPSAKREKAVPKELPHSSRNEAKNQ
jgi:hypothetical protein